MAEFRRGKTKRKQLKDDDSEKPTKEEYAVAKYLRFNAPSKEGKFLGNSVRYFIGSKAVDVLLDSKWSSKQTKSNPLFTNRTSCVNYCERLLSKGFFHRVAKPEKKKKPKENVPEKVSNSKEEKKLEKKLKKDEQLMELKKDTTLESKDKKEKETKEDENNDVIQKEKEDSCQDDKKHKKKKLKLEMHDKQIFLDSVDLYVWIYDPVPVKTFIIGLFLVLGAIGICLFPLWPPEVKLGVYYLSLAAAGFIGVILSLCILRMILFVIVYSFTFGKITFWILPNLTEDVGFFESFRPAYRCDLKDASKTEGKETEKKNEELAINEETQEEREIEEEDEEEEEGEEEMDKDENGYSRSSNENGYELVDAADVEDQGQDVGHGDAEEDLCPGQDVGHGDAKEDLGQGQDVGHGDAEEDLGQGDSEEKEEEEEKDERQNRRKLTKKKGKTTTTAESKKTK